MTNLRQKYDNLEIHVTQRDGSVWAVPVMTVARDRAENYKDEFDNDVERSLDEDTLVLFEDDQAEILDWAANNMNWSDVASVAARAKNPAPLTIRDLQEAWINGKKKVVSK